MTRKNTKFIFCTISVFLGAVLAATGADSGLEPDCEDGFCPVPVSADGAIWTVLPPVPETAIETIVPAPRLQTLSGKTIAIVGGSFMAHVTHPELKRLFLREFPDSKVVLLDEIGSAGPYPRPGVVRRQKDSFQDKLQSFGIDAVISGNGGCGLCTPKETGSCIAAEALGIPSVMIAGPGFTRQARATARDAGLSSLAVVEYPGSFAAHSREELLENTRTSLWPRIKAALTEPPESIDWEKAADAPTGAISGTYEEINRIFLDSGWTDGLPIVPPTESLVADFLRFTDLQPDDLVGVVPPAQRVVRVRHVAVVGAMSGCRPEFMPVLLAFAKAMQEGSFRRTLSSTHAWTPWCWLNGPVARQLGFDSGQGETCEPANAALGRFISLALVDFGGYRVKENRMGTFGYMMPWCMVEDEKAAKAVGWNPWHVQRGFAATNSTLTAVSAINWGNNLAPSTTDPEKIKDMIAWDAVEKQQMAVGSGMPLVHRVFLLTPEVARNLSRKYKSKTELEQALVAAARIPLDMRTFASYWGNPGSSPGEKGVSLDAYTRRIASAEGAARTALPPWLAWTGAEEVQTVPAMAEGRSAIIVTGDKARNKEMCLPGGAFATVRIELPKKWDELVAERGYKPLSDFF